MATSLPSGPSALTRSGSWRARRETVREPALIAVLYLGYTLSRLLADDDVAAARDAASALLAFQRHLGLDIEAGLNMWTSHHLLAGVLASYWYSTAHYLVTAAVMAYMWVRHRDLYRTARTALVAATVLALLVYLTLPVAPPRLMPGYVDVLAQTSPWGWWGAQASAPRGLGSLTNQLAAMPSMHVGWSVWVALTLGRIAEDPHVRRALWAYPAITTTVVIATANHWAADAIAGALIVVAAHTIAHRVRSPASGNGAAAVAPGRPRPGRERYVSCISPGSGPWKGTSGERRPPT